MRDTFSNYHPISNILYFILTIGISMITQNPYILLFSLVCSLTYMIFLTGKKALKFFITFAVPLFLISAIINPLFNHKGIKILFYTFSGNPITLESIIFGLLSGLMFVCVINLFSCFNSVITSDKIIFLFGKILPSISLIISMILRFIPHFREKTKEIIMSQKCVGNLNNDTNVKEKIKSSISILSIMTTWALESSIETADSMKARGYGMQNRTSFSMYKFSKRDFLICIVMMLLFALFLLTYSGAKISLFPMIKFDYFGTRNIICSLSFGGICALPIVLRIAEEIKWLYLKSKI